MYIDFRDESECSFGERLQEISCAQSSLLLDRMCQARYGALRKFEFPP